MQATDAVWHLLNFAMPAVGLGLLSAGLTRLVWRRELRQRRFRVLVAWAVAASLLASIAGLIVFERDGRMATYAAMVVACAGALWWSGFRTAKR